MLEKKTCQEMRRGLGSESIFSEDAIERKRRCNREKERLKGHQDAREVLFSNGRPILWSFLKVAGEELSISKEDEGHITES